MPTRLAHTQSNFALGIESLPATNNQSNFFAKDMENARSNEEGNLRPRYAIQDRFDVGGTVTGIASIRRGEQDIVFYTKSIPAGGVLGLLVNGVTPTDLLTDTNISGRLTALFIIKDVAILKTEGDDQGYWIDLSDYPNSYPIYNLGINPPDVSGITTVALTGGAIAQGWVYYKLTELRRDIPTAMPPNEPQIFNDMESQGSESVEVEVPSVGDDNMVQLDNIPTIIDPQAQWQVLYRSTSQVAPSADPDTLDYYLVAILDGLQSTYIDNDPDSTILNNAQMSIRNERLPSTAKSIAFHVDKIFAANETELRYSDVREGDPVWWAFPEENSLQDELDSQFCSSYRGLLLTGGRHGIWRLTGETAFNFLLQRIATIGPLTAYSWKHIQLEDPAIDAIAFVGTNGLYFCDGVTVQAIHGKVLRFFRDHTFFEGTVIDLPTEEILFHLVGRSISNTAALADEWTFLRKPTGIWEKWSGIRFYQATSIVEAEPSSNEPITAILIAEPTGTEIREIKWNRPDLKADRRSQSQSETIGWVWESQEIDFGQSVRFRWLEIIPEADLTNIGARFWIDRTQGIVELIDLIPKNTHHPRRIQINRRGQNIRFRISSSDLNGIGLDSIKIFYS